MTVMMAPLYDGETEEQVGIAVVETSLYAVSADSVAMMAVALSGGEGFYEVIDYKAASSTATPSPESDLSLMVMLENEGDIDTLRKSMKLYEVSDDTMPPKPIALKETKYSEGEAIEQQEQDVNFTEVEEGEDGSSKKGFLIDLKHMGDKDGKWKVTADCDFTCQLVASAPLTTLELSLTGYNATSTVKNGRDGKTYAVRYYLDTKKDGTGEHYFLDMMETAPYTYKVPSEGSIAPSRDYYVTAVLVEKVVGDFNDDGETTEDEYSWVTVDTKTSADKVTYTNTSKPNKPTNVTIDATGNETLTAAWDGVAKADGYRVTLYYQEGGTWKQAGASYELDNGDFTKGGAATVNGGRYSLRMAPTVAGNSVTVSPNEAKPEESGINLSGGTSDEAPTDVNYKVAVEAIRYEESAINYENVGAKTEKANVRYFSDPAVSSEVNLPKYTAPEITVTSGRQTVTLNGANGYGEMVWGEIPDRTLFTVKGEVDGITVTPEQGKGRFTVAGGGGTWTVEADAAGEELIANSGRVRIVAEKGNDRTEYYLRLVLDDVPPIITVDAKNVRADMTTGAYNVTGQTEPGLEVIMDSTPELKGVADAEGRFSLSGTLPASAEGSETKFDSILASLTARDGAGNEAEPASVVISARPETQWDRPPAVPETPSSGGGRRSGGSSFPTIIAIRSSADAASVTDYTDGIYGLTFRSSASFASFLGVQVDGKTIHPSNYIAEEGSIVVYLKAVYLRTLRKGLHTVTILSSEGNASMNFTIGGVNSALTYDEGIGVYVCYGALSLAGMLLLRRRRIRN